MKTFIIILIILAGCLESYAQKTDSEEQTLFNPPPSVSIEEKAMLETMMQDKSFAFLDRRNVEFLFEINTPKLNLYNAYLKKTSDTIKVLKKASVGWEGQYTLTWFAVEQGKIRIIEAFYGDSSASGELQYVREYTPKEIRLGYYGKNRQCVPSNDEKLFKKKEVCLAYKISAEEKEKIF